MSEIKNTLLGLVLRLAPSVLPLTGTADEIRRNIVDGNFYRWDPDEGVDGEWVLFGAGGSGDSTLIGLPPDGAYGDVTADVVNVPGLEDEDTVSLAFDKVVTILDKLAPELPPNLSDINLVLSGAYTALEATTGTSRTTVTSNDQPTLTASEAFYDATRGTLSAEINSTEDGSIALTTGDDSGTDGALEITSDEDYYVGVFGQEGFWFALMARIIPTSALNLGANLIEMLHSITGTASLNVYVDDPETPIVSGQAVVGSGAGRTVSGVPSLATGDTINAQFDADDVISEFYNVTRIVRAESGQTNNVNAPLPGTPPAKGATIAANIDLTVQANQYSENVTVTCRAYASNGTQGTQTASNNIRVDTVSNESARSRSGQGQYPAQGTDPDEFGAAFDSSVSLVTAGNEELQMLNGQYQFPTGNYTSNTPTAGPNYSSAAGGTHADMRWVTLNLGSISSAVSTQINLGNVSNLGGDVLISGFLMYVRVVGATPTTGWVDGNAAYPGVGDPTANGDAALNVGASTVTNRVVTFGSAVKTGDVWVRIGIPQGSNKRIGTITRV